MKTALSIPALFACLLLAAQNQVIRTTFTPDPAPYAHGDKVYLFVDHDEDDATYFKMKDWQLYATEDMVNWTYLGTPVSTATFPWAFQGDRAWASQAVERGGKWYWYVCLTEAATRADALAGAVADNPQGPYEDAIGGPLATGFGFIDPTVFVDDDGDIGKAALEKERLIAAEIGGRIGKDLLEALAAALVATGKEGEAARTPAFAPEERPQDPFGMGGLARAAHCDVAHRHHRHVKLLLPKQANIECGIAQPHAGAISP